eukprot:CAMPEP_0195528906 /NCGR_PEP_ID=MMETSP0794_2-20130614/31266_1 /TAXON_ID=515487 /ORGANISM="Stephanopyxis turris, Strain CCMP 815" /LENGTH=139 /DNA_ID=CAMNT_0040660117 /DNA_START=80 /DNA_END=499 /DNA_ORIENTATION=+
MAESNNLGAQMAGAVDSEIAIYRTLQEELSKLRSDQQVLMSQENENQMVKQELDLLDDSANVYKMVGPVLMKNDVDDAKQTVEKRLEFISGEIKKIENNIKKTDTKSTETAKKIQEMQSAMQAAAAEAAKQIAKEKGQG